MSALTTIVTATANTPIAALRGVTRPIRLRELSLSAITAATTSGGIGLTRSTALGTGGLTSVTGQPLDSGNNTAAATGVLVTAWATTAPTINTAAYLRRFGFPPSIGASVIWTWPSGEEVIIPGSAAATSEFVIVNLQGTAPGTWFISAKWEE